jgi:hypothetical protein
MVTVMTGSRGEPYERALRMIRQIRDGRHESLSLAGMQLTALGWRCTALNQDFIEN